MAAYENSSLLVDYGSGYIDVTRYVDWARSPIDAGIGDSAETSGQPGTLQVVLNNVGHRFTPGNADGGPTYVTDTFGRTVANGWGFSDTGLGWGIAEGPAADISVGGGVGVHTHPVASTNHSTIMDMSSPDHDATVFFNLPALPVGGGAQAIVDWRIRWIDVSNYCMVRVAVDTAGTMAFKLQRTTNAGGFLLAVGTSLTWDANHWYGLRLSAQGQTLKAKFWDATTTVEPDWQISGVDAFAADLPGNLINPFSNALGCTNLPYIVNFDSLRVRAAQTLSTGLPLQLRETIAGNVNKIHTGTIEFPEIMDWAATVTDQQITVSSVDLVSSLDRSPTMVSTLAAHILANGGGVLRNYWPCTEAGQVFADVYGGDLPIKEVVGLDSNLSDSTTTGQKAVVGQGSGPLLADDAQLCRLDATVGFAGIPGVSYAPRMQNGGTVGGTIAVGEVVTLVGWYYPQLPANKLTAGLLQMFSNNIALDLETNDAAGTLKLIAFGGFPLTGTINGPLLPDQAWVPLAIRYGFNPSVFEMWVGTNRYVGVLAGTPPASDQIGGLNLAEFYAGGMGHIQLYRGSPTAWGFVDYLAQVAMAGAGLERQTTGDRIRTLGRYAGLTDTQLSGVDKGCSVMSTARLAGKTIGAAMAEARDTEQGRLFAAGDGTLTFHDRRTVLNI